VPAAEIAQCLADVEEALIPAPPDAIAVLLHPLADLFGDPRPEAVPIYFSLLSHVPEDVLGKAVERCLGECKFYPLPAEILERSGEVGARLVVRMRLEWALKVAERSERLR
jgi:hypothetical protein